MTAISDGVVIGVVLGLIFAAVCYYLYSRVNQLERKVGLMENILLDLKVAQQSLFAGPDSSDQGNESTSNHEEFHQYREAIAEASAEANGESHAEYRPPTPTTELRDVHLDGTPRSRTPQQSISITREGSDMPSSVQEQLESSNQSSVSVNYESMTYKELTQLAKQMGISGLRNQSKAFIIDAIRQHVSGKGTSSGKDKVESSTMNVTGLSNWTKSSINFDEEGSQANSFQVPLDQVGNIELSSAQPVTFGGTPIDDTQPMVDLEQHE
jgi:hypothetical protein